MYSFRYDRGMSKQQPVLLIQPPLFLKEQPVERVEFGGFKCSHCHGNGWFWGMDEYGERIKRECPVCKGSKRLKAVVTVSWKADNENNNQL
ncbi:hypothetical protein [Phocaeicola massiliensis]|uniref:hypothetical protein n=2 Tax=Bacteroidia TaxID=200643 RepID=UPI001E4FF68D|nr:hypothetical protein [Phocaeicola massiliensis]DAW97751.1 MAG TPA: anti-TRAP protein [Bacteriophage sp.]